MFPIHSPDALGVIEFLDKLHTDPIGTSPARTAWRSRSFTTRPGVPRIPLDGPRPGWLPGTPPAPGDLAWLGDLLFRAAGRHRVRWSPTGVRYSSPERPGMRDPGLFWETRRTCASGGAMYPAEIYVLVRALRGLVPGIYHFDSARHELARLAGLPELDLPRAELTFVIVCDFTKSVPKYGDFAYRLTAVDTGVVVGRMAALLVADGVSTELDFDFADEDLDRVLGLGPSAGAYAVLKVGTGRDAPRPSRRHSAPLGAPQLQAAHRAARATRYNPARTARPSPAPSMLPAATPLMLAARRSDGALFDGRQITAGQLQKVLCGGSGGLWLLGGLAGARDLPMPVLAVTVQRVDGVTHGSYLVDADGPTPRRTGDLSHRLEESLHARTVNLRLAAFTVHVLGPRRPTSGAWGVRGYRVAQMLAGAVVDQLTLAAAAAGLSAHPLLGFRAEVVDDLYELDGDTRTTLVQVPVGHTRTGLRLEGSVIA